MLVEANGRWVNWPPLIVVIALVTFPRFCLPYPTTTTSPSVLLVFTSDTSPASALISWVAYPILVSINVAPGAASMLYSPMLFVVAAFPFPFTVTVTPSMGAPVTASVILPLANCAFAPRNATKKSRNKSVIFFIFFILKFNN